MIVRCALCGLVEVPPLPGYTHVPDLVSHHTSDSHRTIITLAHALGPIGRRVVAEWNQERGATDG